MRIDKLQLNNQSLLLREELGEDSRSPIDVFTVSQRIPDLTLLLYPMGDRISGICVKDDGIKIISINSQTSRGRQRFSLAHELYHLCVEKNEGFSVSALSPSSSNDTERNADLFASFFLMPSASLYAYVNKYNVNKKTISLDRVVELEQYYGMSRRATLLRLREEDLISPEVAESMTIEVINSALARGYTPDLYRPSPVEEQKRTYGHYIKQVEALLESDKISHGKYEGLLLDAFRDDMVFGNGDAGGELID